MDLWNHLLLTGEFRQRKELLSGLTLEQVTLRPGGAPHSIYEELWHAVTWQRIIVEGDKEAADALLRGGENYPSAALEHQQQWEDLVQQFLKGARAAVEWAQEPDRLVVEVEPGVTMSDELCAGGNSFRELTGDDLKKMFTDVFLTFRWLEYLPIRAGLSP